MCAETLGEWLYVVEIEVTDPMIEDDWNTWYSGEHLAEFVEIPGIRRGDRYVTESPGLARRYITVYQIEGPEVIGSPEFESRRSWSRFGDGLHYRTAIFRRMVGLDGTTHVLGEESTAD